MGGIHAEQNVVRRQDAVKNKKTKNKKQTQKEWGGVGGGLVGVGRGERKRKLACIQECVRPHTI